MSGRRPGEGTREAAIALSAYLAYLVVRQLVWNERGRQRARLRAQRLYELEQSMGIGVEPAVQRVALRFPSITRALNAGYALGNVALSVGWLLILFRRGDPSFARERRAALIAFCGALPVFAALPTAPPRTLDGFVDTMAGERGGLDHPFLVRFYNPIAAMPSHHVAFAVVTGFGLAAGSRRRSARLGWAAYPALVALVVVATANHFVADVLAGAALGVLARRFSR